MNFITSCRDSFVNAAESIEYGFNPKSLIVLVPIVSLIVQEIKVSSIKRNVRAEPLNLPGNKFDAKEIVERKSPLSETYKWHGIGAIIQILALAFFVNLCPLLVIPVVAIGVYQAWKCFMDSQKLQIEFTQDSIKRIS